jgi:hypothetical protein
MSQLNDKLNKSKASHVYFDVQVSNLASTAVKPVPFYYSDTRTTPYLNVPEDYTMSIIRFTCGTESLPIFIPQIQVNQNDRDLTIYSVTLKFKNIEVQTFINYNPQDLSAPLPPAPNQTTNGRQYNQDGYYNVYSYTFFIERVYAAFTTCFNALNVLVVASGDVLPTIYPPLISWDPTTNSATLYGDTEAYDVNPGIVVDPIGVFMNAPLFSLFNSFPAIFLGYNVTNGKNYKIPFIDIGGTNAVNLIPPGQPIPVPPATYTTYRAILWTQEQSTIASWSPIVSVVFTSNTLPIEANQVSTPVVFSNNQNITLGGNNSDFANIITDIVSSDGNYRPNLVYNPSAEYRRIALKGNRPLYSIDLNVYYKIITGELIPIRLFSNESITIKILFEKIVK